MMDCAIPAGAAPYPAAPAPSPLSLLEPDLVTESAAFFVHAGWAPEDLDAFGGDPEFTAEVMAAMRALEAPGGAR